MPKALCMRTKVLCDHHLASLAPGTSSGTMHCQECGRTWADYEDWPVPGPAYQMVQVDPGNFGQISRWLDA